VIHWNVDLIEELNHWNMLMLEKKDATQKWADTSSFFTLTTMNVASITKDIVILPV